MKQILRSTSELPEWFNLAKYEGQANLSSKEWLTLLTKRRDLLIFLQEREAFATPPAGKLVALRENPLSCNDDPSSGPTFLEVINSGPVQPSAAVRRLTYRGLEHVLSIVDPSRLEYLRKWRDDILSNAQRLVEILNLSIQQSDEDASKSLEDLTFTTAYPYVPWIDEQIELNEPESEEDDTRSGTLCLVINTQLPDNLIVSEVKRVLNAYRGEDRQPDKVTRYRRFNPNQLISAAVLPWLDLVIWALEVNVQIPYRVLADAIFPDGTGGEEKVRTTTQAVATSVLQKLDRLRLEIDAFPET